MYTIYIWFWPTLTMSTAADAAHDYGFGQNHIYRVGQSCIYTLYMTVCLVISLPKMPYVHRIYIYMVLASPTSALCRGGPVPLLVWLGSDVDYKHP
jgi:hypothetical protein